MSASNAFMSINNKLVSASKAIVSLVSANNVFLSADKSSVSVGRIILSGDKRVELTNFDGGSIYLNCL